MQLTTRMKENLRVQGFLCDAPQFKEVEPWLRFNPAICFLVAAFGLYFTSSNTFFVLAAFAAIGAIFPHAVGDLIYNYGIRRITGKIALPPNPPPRRFACFVGAVWSIAIAASFLYGYAALAYILGITFLLVVTPMVTRHFCIASLIYQKIIVVV